jgi:hypothetical protein
MYLVMTSLGLLLWFSVIAWLVRNEPSGSRKLLVVCALYFVAGPFFSHVTSTLSAWLIQINTASNSSDNMLARNLVATMNINLFLMLVVLILPVVLLGIIFVIFRRTIRQSLASPVVQVRSFKKIGLAMTIAALVCIAMLLVAPIRKPREVAMGIQATATSGQRQTDASTAGGPLGSTIQLLSSIKLCADGDLLPGSLRYPWYVVVVALSLLLSLLEWVLIVEGVLFRIRMNVYSKAMLASAFFLILIFPHPLTAAAALASLLWLVFIIVPSVCLFRGFIGKVGARALLLAPLLFFYLLDLAYVESRSFEELLKIGSTR